MTSFEASTLAATLPDLLADRRPSTGSDFETFAAHRAGFCPRQLYLGHLGLRDDTDTQGRFVAGQLIHDFVEDRLAEGHPDLEIGPQVVFSDGQVQYHGRPTAYDPQQDVVWHVKPRNGWHKFHPPNERHLDQLQIYLHGLDADQGQLVYISMADVTDIRTWPEGSLLGPAPDRLEKVISRAEAVRRRIIANGIARNESAVPFERCGCFLCKTETIDFPETADAPRRTPQSTSTDATEAPDEATGAVPSAPSLDLPDREPEVLNIGQRHVPGALRDLDYWVVWDGREKIPRAPWQEGTMYPCHWGAEADQDPRVGFERAKMVAELPIGELHRSWPFPDEEDLPEQVLPAVLLPHAPESSGLAVVDFDDVRDPDTGLVTGEVCELLERLNGYAEVSMSGTGIHVYVRGQLPEEVTAVSGPLQEPGQIEIYDHSRFTASTWRHIEGTPNSELADATEILRELAAAFNGRRINTA